MAIAVRECGGALLFARFIPHKVKNGEEIPANYKDGYIRGRPGDSINVQKRDKILDKGVVPRSILGDHRPTTAQERLWILEALQEWTPGTDFEKVYK